jgi:hypothetical protein
MESLDELSKINSGKPGFFKHVFKFDEESKADMLNIIQYAVIAIIPIIILNKTMKKYDPEVDETKSSLEISVEIIVKIIVMFISLLIIHRIITFIPTYSGEKYPEFHVVYIILATLMIIMSLQTNIGEKVAILVDRIVELWEGPKDTKGKKGNGSVKVSQPISQNQSAMNQSLNSMGSTSISSLPAPQSTMTQQLPNYDQMYQQDTTPLVGASTPGMETFEPQAANGGFGAFGSAFGGNW